MSIKAQCPSCGKVSQFSASDVGLVTLCVACGARFWVQPEGARGEEGDPVDAAFGAAASNTGDAPPAAVEAPSAGGVEPSLNSETRTPAVDALAALADSDYADASLAAADALAVALGGSRAAAQAPVFPGDSVSGEAPLPSPPPPNSVYTPRPPIATIPAAGAATPPRYEPPADAPEKPLRPGLLFALFGGATALVIILGVLIVVATRPNWEQRNAATIRELKAQAEAFTAHQNYQNAYDTYARLDAVVGNREIRDARLRGDVERARQDRDGLVRVLVAAAQGQYATVRLPQVTQPPTTGQAATAPATPDNAVASATGGSAAPAVTTPVPTPSRPPDSVDVAPTPTAPTTPATQVAVIPPPKARPGRSHLPTTRRLAATAPTWMARPAVRVWPLDPGGIPETGLTDEAIGQAIQRSVNYLLAKYRNGTLNGNTGITGDAMPTGRNALCTYALLQAAYAIRDERLNLKGPVVREMLDALKAMPADGNHAVYARSIRATALALVGRPEDRSAMLADSAYLLAANMNGAYTYQKPKTQPKPGEILYSGWDNSNSQYGLLGVWAAAEAGAEVNSTYWQAVEDHWTRFQNGNGSWEYAGSDPNGPGKISMALAGVTSLFVTHDYLDAPKLAGQVGREPFSKALAKGLAYLESGDVAVNGGGLGGYSVYGLERVGLASGFKFLGEHDWYREVAADLIRRQAGDGTWSFGGQNSITWDSDVETAFNLLFLARGRHPILMNKLRYDGPWANRPRDVANLARFGTRELERPLNWQVVPIWRDWTDWMDAPILYVATHQPVPLGDAELAKFRAYVEAGGMIFTQADGSIQDADLWAQALADKLFPQYPMKDLPEDHELYGVLYKPGDRPPLKYVTNGSRILMLHSPTDVTQIWQMRNERTRRGMFELGMNLFLYASGKADLRNRLTSPVIPPPDEPAAGGRVAVARVRYSGNWDPEPGAWPRFGRYFQRETDVALDVAPTELGQLNPHVAGFAHWTGTAAYTPTDAEIAAIRKYVEEGGVLLVEPTGGSSEFFQSAQAALRKAFPDVQPDMVGKMHPMLTASGPAMDDLSAPRVRAYVKTRGFNTSGRIDAIGFGRGKVILSPLDLTTGLLGCNTWGVLGFDPAYSLKLVKNVVLWSATGMAEDGEGTAGPAPSSAPATRGASSSPSSSSPSPSSQPRS